MPAQGVTARVVVGDGVESVPRLSWAPGVDHRVQALSLPFPVAADPDSWGGGDHREIAGVYMQGLALRAKRDHARERLERAERAETLARCAYPDADDLVGRRLWRSQPWWRRAWGWLFGP